MKKLRKEQWISFGLFICVLGIVAGCTAFRHFAGAETPQGGGDLNVLAQSEGETQQVGEKKPAAWRGRLANGRSGFSRKILCGKSAQRD